ncbi:MAG: response regulator [Candidatus Scalindua sp.]
MSKVLLVDDSATMRRIIKREIDKIGFVVDEYIEAGDGKQALEEVFNRPVDLILLDWNMPVMDGLTFVQTLRSLSLPKRIPVIMVTTEGSHERVNEALKSGADDHILKPIDAKRLRDVLGKYLTIG